MPAKTPIADRLSFERELWSQGITPIAGVDEAGRGPLAGAVVVAAVITECKKESAKVEKTINS